MIFIIANWPIIPCPTCGADAFYYGDTYPETYKCSACGNLFTK